MKIAFYYSAYGTWIDKMINLFSGRVGFSHVELVFSDGWSYSSSPRDGGVRFKKVEFDQTHWKMFDLPITPLEEGDLKVMGEKFVGEKYDWLGVIGFVIPVSRIRHKQFCSEVIVRLLQEVGLISHVPPYSVSPNSLYLIMISELKGLTLDVAGNEIKS